MKISKFITNLILGRRKTAFQKTVSFLKKAFIVFKQKFKSSPWFIITVISIFVLNVSLFIRFLPHSTKKPALKLQSTPIKSTYLYQSNNQGFKIYLGNKKAKQNPQVKFETENSSIDFQLADFKASKQTKINKTDNKTITYKNIYPDIDFIYALTEKGVKEEIIINNQQAIINNPQFTFKLNLKNTIPQKDLMGNLTSTFIDKQNGNYRFHFETPFMVDATGKRSNQVGLKINQYDALSYTATLIPDSNWLRSAVYPVIIDPTLVHDEQSDFSNGGFNRTKDVGVGETAPSIELYEQEMLADLNTVGLWHMNETSGSNIADSSLNENDGIATGTTIVDGKLDKARNFNGSSDVVSISDSASLDIANGLTIEAWVKPSDSNGHIILAKEGAYQLQLSNNKIELVLQIGTSEPRLLGSSDITDEWTHIAATYDGANMKVYKNGILDGDQLQAGSISINTNNTYLGGIPEKLLMKGYNGTFSVASSATWNTILGYTYTGSVLSGTMDVNWGTGAPSGLGTNADNFTVAWEGNIYLAYAETYTFYQYVDDDGFIEIYSGGNWQRVLNADWSTEDSGTFNCPAVGSYPIRIAASEQAGGALNRVRYSSPSESLKVIPTSALSTVFNGQIDEVRISNVARTPEEIKADAEKRPYGTYISPTLDLTSSISSLNSLSWSEDIPSGTAASGLPKSYIEFQTRTSTDNSTWEEWKPVGVGEAVLDNMDNLSNWVLPSSSIWSGIPVSTASETDIKIEDSASIKTIVGSPLVDANTVGLWHFDETSIGTGSTTYDSSGNNNYGVATGTTLTEGFYGKARTFNGASNHYIGFSNPGSLQINNQTICAWVKTTDADTKGYIYSSRDTSAGGGTFYMDANKSTFHIAATNSGASSNTTYADGRWHHVCVTFNDSTNVVTYYLDGTTDGSTTNTGTIAHTVNKQIGNRVDGTTTTSFDGSIDEVWISNIVRTAEEIAEAYRAGKDHRIERTLSSTDLSSNNKIPFYIASDRLGTYLETYTGENSYSVYQPDANTVGFWHLDEKSGSGAYLKDSSGNSNHGTPTSATFAQGQIGGGIYFNGSTAYVNTTDKDYFSPYVNDMTISFWAKVPTWAAASGNGNAGSTGRYMVSKGIANHWEWAFENDNNNLICLSLWTLAGNETATISTSRTVNDSQWHYYTATIDYLTEVKLYIDGIEISNDETWGDAMGNGTQPVQIGRRGDGNYFIGEIDEVHISNTVRSVDEIRQAYEYGLRTHQITIDYSTGIGSSAPTSTSDLDFNPTTTENLYVGDVVIVREKVEETTYIMQGEVTGISSGAVTVASWSGTAPPSGYTTNANVFKWQKEYWDISDIPTADRDAITKLGLRVLDGSEGFDMYLDDFKTSGAYLTDPNGGETITSTPQRYFQYKAIFTTNDTTVTPSLSSVTLDYTTNQTPTAPDELLTNDQINPTALGVGTTSPYFSAVYNDPDATDIANKYQIQVDDDLLFGSPIWDSGSSGTAMGDCAQGNRCTDILYDGSDLNGNTTYYWRIKFWDDDEAEGAWSTETASFSVNYAPISPTGLLTEGLTNPDTVIDTTPEFSAIYNENVLDIGDTANKYQIQVDDDPLFGSPIWDSGSSGTVMDACVDGNRCSDISYDGSSLSPGIVYYWRIKYWDDDGAEGVWSTEEANFTIPITYSPTACMIDDGGQPGATIIEWSDNTNLETGYRIERSIDDGEWILLTTEITNSTSYTDNTTLSGHTYKYRVRAEGEIEDSIWCTTDTVNYGLGNFYFR